VPVTGCRLLPAWRPGVLDGELYLAAPGVKGDLHGGGRSGVPEGVGECLLRDAVDGELQPGCKRGHVASGGVGDVRAGGPDTVEQAGQVGGAWLGAQVRLAGIAGRVLAQGAEGEAELTERLPAGRRDQPHRLGGAFGAGPGQGGAAVREPDDDGQVVPDDVVHLPGYPRPFGGGGELRSLVAFGFQPGGAVCHRGELGLAGTAGQAQADRRRRAA
jgi:hypothetical protein